jgi:hypothetical protein
MFGQGRQQAIGPSVELYDLNQIGQQFMNWSFGLGQPWDQHTPEIALLTIQEIQNHAGKPGAHPIRIGMFNIISENGFNNAMFQDLVQVVVLRAAMGVAHSEWRNLNMAVTTTIACCVKSFASFLAAGDEAFMAGLQPAEQAAARENAEIWNYLVALVQGQANFVAFNDMQSGGFNAVSGSTQQALASARGLRGTSAGAFNENVGGYEGAGPGRYNNDAGPSSGRYGRKLEAMFGKLEGSMQQALQGSGTAGGPPNAPQPYRSRFANRGMTGQQAAKFDSDVTDFSKSLDQSTTTVQEAPASVLAAEEAKKSIFTVQMDGKVVGILREIKDGGASWKPSKLQRFHPAWCKRTHACRYFETDQNAVVAILIALTEEQKEIAMNYDAHAIDPSMGKPDPAIPQKPVREEAKALYTDAKSVSVNVVINPNFSAEEDVSGAVRSTRISAEMSETVPDAQVRLSLVNQPVIYATAADAEEDAIMIRAIAGSKDFAEAASYLPKVRSELARKTINTVLVKAVNRAIECEIGIGVRISDFIEDGPEIIAFLEKNNGALVGEKLRTHQTFLLNANVRVVPATEMKDYADATLTTEGQDELSEAMLKRVLFLQRNVAVAWVNFTDDEMAIGVPPKGPAVIDENSLGALHSIARSVFVDAIGDLAFSEQYLITKDNVRYRMHRGLLNKEAFLLSMEPK